MSIYQIIGAIWGVNFIILIMLISEADDDSHKYLQYINKFIVKHVGVFVACYVSTIIIVIQLLKL